MDLTTTAAKSLKKDRIIYWTSTIIVMLFDAGGAVMFNSPLAVNAMHHLGFPDYFRVELSIAKMIGGIVVVIPAMPRLLKEWAYAGFFIATISAIIANYAVNGLLFVSMPLVVLLLLTVSYIYYHEVFTRAALKK